MIEYEDEVYFDEFDMNVDGCIVGFNIAINKKFKTSTEKTCILAEEIGHYKTTVGDILDLRHISNRKQEARARKWGYEKLLSIEILISAFNLGCTSKYELAEFAGVTEEFLEAAITRYINQYGSFKNHGDYTVFFEPLGIMMSL